MRISDLRHSTLREPPAEATSVNERYLRRAGFVRKVEAGSYVFLPLGARVVRKMMRLMEREAERAGFQQVIPSPGVPTRELIKVARSQVRSWRALPLGWYTWNRVRREEAEPRGGLLETREQMYLQVLAFTTDEQSAHTGAAVRDMLSHACQQMGLEVLAGEGDGWQVQALVSNGEDRLLQCTSCERAFVPEWCPLPHSGSPASCEGIPPARVVDTPGLRTVDEVARFLNVSPSNLVKTLWVEADGTALTVLVRGDHELSLPKLRRMMGARQVEMLSAERVEQISRAPVGFAGPVGLSKVPLFADWAVREIQGFVVGANLADAHRVHVCWERDFPEPVWGDLRVASGGDRCAYCGGEMVIRQGVLLGSVRVCQEQQGLVYDDAQGTQRAVSIIVADLNLLRAIAALVETSHDSDGMVWKPRIAPFEVIVLVLNPAEEEHLRLTERLCASMQERGIDVLLDDRDERAGAKFKDADLVGIPVQVVVGRTASEGAVEVRLRRDRKPHRVALEDVAIVVEELLHREAGEE
ncbi:MAG: proline--tRNA ligase [Armatimonadota bacterium]